MSAPELAVIVAAGRGVRLKGMGEQRPKGFIELGGRALIERSVELLTAAGVERTLIVTGHLREWYEDFARRTPNVELAHNPEYAASGSMYTLWLARELIHEDFVLAESDLVYEKRALEVLFGAPGADTLLVSGPTRSGDEVYVEADGGRLTGLSKQRARLTGDVVGELVGLTRISRRCLDAMCAHAEGVFRESKHLEYEQALVAAAREVRVDCPVVADLAWTEIDDETHLKRAIEQIYPRIMEREAAYAC
ncbi:MAG TPA: phosphocholine cytidylyltransferase family protein [Burkholderiales bacterium]|nr:phosphocholine cytidylyltransferase family protein [Burkholderiales bacterium]